jgi:D-aminopeptidase
VAETYDGFLNDINGLHVRPAHAREAIEAAKSGPLTEGNVGGGTGMITYEFKGGTGTASRIVPLGGHDYTLGILVQANHGRREWFTVLGVPVGPELTEGRILHREQGSIIVIMATDIPMLPHQLERLAQRGSIGIGRGGTPGGNSSGDIFLAFSTANERTREEFRSGPNHIVGMPDEWFDPIYLAAVEAVEEAIVNAMLAAEDTPTLKPAGQVCRAIDPDRLVGILARHGRIR